MGTKRASQNAEVIVLLPDIGNDWRKWNKTKNVKQNKTMKKKLHFYVNKTKRIYRLFTHGTARVNKMVFAAPIDRDKEFHIWYNLIRSPLWVVGNHKRIYVSSAESFFSHLDIFISL